MNYLNLSSLILFSLTLLVQNEIVRSEETRCEMNIDLTEIDRNLISATISIPVKPGDLSLWYPKWLPGCHAPAGPIQNLAHFEVVTDQGETLTWKRRSAEPYEFLLNVPNGVEKITVTIEYIPNQATTNSAGADCAFEGNVGYFSFNSCVVYPTSLDHAYGTGNELIFDVSLQLPQGCAARGAIKSNSAEEGKLTYDAVPFHRLVDCPLILGEHIKTISLTPPDSQLPPHFLHVASSESEDTDIPPEFVKGLQKLVAEAAVVFGEAPFADYHFLMIIDDELSDIGLEHSNSSLNTMSAEEIEDPGLRSDWPAELLPHEYVHAWCGKYRIPRNMAQLDFHSDRDFSLLWVYEGLTEYYGTVLAARSALVDKEVFLDHKAQRTHELSMQAGRRWRSLEDTAITSHLLRDFSNYWQYKRRDQDYYDEGAMYWWEADALIRTESEGSKSLDDFCRVFFSKRAEENANLDAVPYVEVEVYRTLEQTHPFNWKAFFQKRVKATQKTLNMRALARSKYRLLYGESPNAYQLRLESQYGYIDESTALGLFIGSDASITTLVPNSPGDKAKLAEGDTITHLNGEKYSDLSLRQWLDEALPDSKLRLTVTRHDKEFDVELTIANPKARYPYLENVGDKDLIQEIINPKAEQLVP